jgi:organic hydroperoxide reductase OsmC/OhrA
MALTPKRLEYEASVGESRRVQANGVAVEIPDSWHAEQLVLAGLVHCTLASLRYHARRASIVVHRARGAASGAVTKRESDGRYALVEVRAALDVEIDPEPDAHALAELLAKAERDCFVGNSLSVRPEYGWQVNGRDQA